MSGTDSTQAAAVAQNLADLLNRTGDLGVVVIPQISREFDVSYSISWCSDGRDHVSCVEWDYAEQKWLVSSASSEEAGQ